MIDWYSKIINNHKGDHQNLRIGRNDIIRTTNWAINVASWCWRIVKIPVEQLVNNQAQSIKRWSENYSWQNKQLRESKHRIEVTKSMIMIDKIW